MTKSSARATAIDLRKRGHSHNYIAPRVGVSKSTLSVWLADVPYTPNAETIARIGKARAASGAAKSKMKQESVRRAYEEAKIQMNTLSKRDLFMLGLGLFIGEGTKTDQGIRFVNANPFVMVLIIRWFIEALGLSRENMRLRLHVYPDSNDLECLNFWSKFTGIPESQFFRSVVDNRPGKAGKKSGKLPYGTAHLSVNSLGNKAFGVFLARKIIAWSDIVLGTDEIAGLV